VWAARHAAKAAEASDSPTAATRVISAFLGAGRKGAG